MIKKSIYAIVFAVLLSACASTPKLSQEELDKFSVKGEEVFYEGKAVAKYESMEYEYFQGKFYLEYSMRQYAGGYNELTEKITKYLASIHPDAKIELKVAKDIKE